jgi:hypothetical protein
MEMNVEEVLRRTLQELGQSGADFSYITEELVRSDYQDLEKFKPLDVGAANEIVYGNNPRYGAWLNPMTNIVEQGYWADHDGDYSRSTCGTGAFSFFNSSFHHTYLGRCKDGRELWQFSR